MELEEHAERQFLRRPWVGALLLSWAVGVVDSYGYDRHGVFTTNQAGNLVIVAHSSVDNFSRVGLAGLALVGAIVGVVLGVSIQKRLPQEYWLRIATPTLVGVTILAVLGVVDIASVPRAELVIPTVALGMALIATGVLNTPFVSNWLTGNTGSLLSATAGVTNSAGRWQRMPQSVRSAIAITSGFILGAASYALFLTESRYALLIGLLPTFIVTLLALSAHRRRAHPLS